MICAIIDIGSNSMRLTAYDVDGKDFKILFREKIIAGLGGYVENGFLTEEGIRRAVAALLEFRTALSALRLTEISVFATASLRNIRNSAEATRAISIASGFDIDVITGEAEALYGYIGAMHEFSATDGVFLDIGGASTEIAVFSDRRITWCDSRAIGSLKLYRECVRGILPGKGSVGRIRKEIGECLSDLPIEGLGKSQPFICVGGTARGALKAARSVYALPEDCRSLSAQQLGGICDVLLPADRAAADLILKLEPERIHTMIPGLLILQHIAVCAAASEITVSRYGVREGYLCEKMIGGK